MTTVTALANPNIAFIKYWGNRDEALNLPASGSISMNLGGLVTRTQVSFDSGLPADILQINEQPAAPEVLQRLSDFLDHVRRLAALDFFAQVSSENNFPMGAGIASSASAFAALALAASHAAGLDLDEAGLSRLARLGSGSACRSVPGGFVEWFPGTNDEDSYAASIAPADHWPLVDLIAIVNREHKAVGSSQGHALAGTSPLQQARVQTAPQRLDRCRRAILQQDFEALAILAELDSNLMHAVMQTSTPPLFYWEPATLALMEEIPVWRGQGLAVFYTVDAGPNLHAICLPDAAEAVRARIAQIPGVESILRAETGGPAKLLALQGRPGGTPKAIE
jgi:diphosphomevalonate decarboxylase